MKKQLLKILTNTFILAMSIMAYSQTIFANNQLPNNTTPTYNVYEKNNKYYNIENNNYTDYYGYKIKIENENQDNILLSKEEFPIECEGHNCELYIKVADCESTGIKNYVCKDCGKLVATRPYNAIGHTYKIVKDNPTCDTDGNILYICVRCGDTYKTNLEHLEHRYIGIYTPPTCVEVGYTAYTCIYCGDEYFDMELPLSHNYARVEYVESTCYSKGKAIFSCVRCGDTYEEYYDMIKHTYKKNNYTIDKDATKTEKGEKSIHCEVCNTIIDGTKKEIPKIK